MSEATNYLVPAKLTDEQCDLLENALLEAEDERDAYDKWIVILRDIGTPVEANGLETVAHMLPDSLNGLKLGAREVSVFPTAYAKTFELVRRTKAEAQITALRAEIARLTAERDRIAQETREKALHLLETVHRPDLTKTEKVEATKRQLEARFLAAAPIRSAGEKA